MNWGEWLKYDAYKKLWSLAGRRKWTYIRRDIWHQFEIINIVFFVSVGFFSGLMYPRIIHWLFSHWYNPIILVSIFYFIGVLHGDFYWGKKYIKDQQG